MLPTTGHLENSRNEKQFENIMAFEVAYSVAPTFGILATPYSPLDSL